MSFQRILGFGVLACLALRVAGQVTWTGVGADGNFTTATNWSSTLSNDGTANLSFGVSTATAPVVNASYSVNSLVYQSGSPTFSIGSSGGASLTVNSSISQLSSAYQTLTAPLTVGPTFTFAGSGATSYLNVTGGITAPSGFRVSSGADVRMSGGWTVAGPVTVDSGSALEFVNSNFSVSNSITNNGAVGFGNGTNTITYSGVISGSGSVTINSPTTFGAANSYGGSTTIGPAALTLAANNALPVISPVTIANDASSVLNLNGYNQTISSLSGGGATGGKILLGSGTLTLAPVSGLSFDGVISGTGSVVVNGGYSMLSGANLYAGGTTVNGTLKLMNATGSGTGTGTVLVSPGAQLLIGLGGTSGAVSGPIVNNGVIRFNRTDAISYGGISGAGSVIQDGTGTLTLSGSNTYTGTTVVGVGVVTDAAAGALPSVGDFMIAAGTLKVAYNESIRLSDNVTNPAGGVTIEPGAVLTLNGGRYYSGTISGGGSLVIGSGVFQTLAGNVTHTGGTTISPSAMLHLGDGTTSGSFAGNITDNGALIFSPGATGATYAGVISGTGNLFVGTATDSLTGAVTLTGANTYTGTTMINSGTLRIGAVNTLPTGTTVIFRADGALEVPMNQTVGKLDSQDYGTGILLGTGATLKISPVAGTYGTFNGLITGTGNIIFAGAANSALSLNNANTYSGSTTITGGTVFVNSQALGTGQVTLMPGAQLAIAKSPSSYDVELPNSIVASDQSAFGGDKDRLLVLMGDVTVPTGSSTVHLGDFVKFAGALKSASGTSLLGFDSAAGSFGRAVITGTINLAGATGTITGFNINTAGVIFGAAGAVPAGPFSIKGSNAYVGIANITGTAPTATSVLSLIDKANFSGVLGFDSLVENSAPAVFTGAVDLTGFGSTLSLGSATSAVLSGPITPDGDYRFGNGGGALVVTSQLTGSRSVVVNSSSAVPGNYLTLVLRNTGIDVNGNEIALPANNFTGNLAITNSLVVLDSASALPAGRTVALGANGYIGFTEAFTGNYSFGDFISTRLVPGGYSATSVIGIDSHDYASDQIRFGYSYSDRWFGDTVDLRTLAPIYLGTTTRATLHGVIWAPTQGGAAKTLSLLAARDATLTIDSPLRAGNVDKVVIGSAASAYASGSVVLRGANTYAGGTTLQSGVLELGENITSATNSGPLGTGVLTVPASATKPVLASDGYSEAIVTNPISLGRSLQIGLPDMTPPAYAARAGVAAMEGPYGYGHLFLNGIISDFDAATHGSLDVYGATYLNAPNTFSGGVTLHDTFLALGNDAALGTGTLTFAPGVTPYSSYQTVLATFNGPRTVANNLVFSGNRDIPITFTGTGSFTFTGSFTLNNDVTLAPEARPVYFNGPITGTGRLLTDGSNAVVLGGSNTYAGGTESQYGAVVFANAAAMPASPAFGAFRAGPSGYIGLQFVPSNLQATFIDRFDKGGTSGAIGFDSADVGSPNTFAGAINLTGFNPSARLGSTSSAILTGAITPAASYYNFGNGGGLLEVRSVLADGGPSSPRGLDVSSNYDAPLTVRLSGANTFSGGVSVSNSGLIFGAGALPATGTIVTYYQAYVGTADSAFGANPNGFINRFSASSSGHIIGFDDALVVTGALSLAGFGPSGDPEVYLGTATTATINGAITLPSLQNAYRFAGYKGGHLTVGSTLTGARSVVIGDASMAATFGTPTNSNLPLSNVKLAAANTYTGGTTLEAGELVVASPTGTSALGTGTLTIESGSMGADGRHLRLLTEDSPQTVGNAIVLGGDLDVGDRLGGNNLTLTGAISGSGALYKVGTDLLTIAGTNTATGGMYVQGGAVTFAHGYSVGSGPLQFQNASSAAVTFNESSTVYGIAGDSFGQSIYMAPGGTFTVNQTFDAEYKGALAVLNTPVTDVVFNGIGSTPVQLTLSGNSTYTTSGATKINSGITILAANANAFGQSTNTVSLNGGKLAVGNGVVLANPLSLVSGNLAGNGTFKAPAASAGYTIGSNLVLSPGVAGPGDLKLDMNGTPLVLAGGGTYEWDLSDAAAAGGWDKVSVTGSVSITATPTAPFNFKIGTIGADGGLSFAANFDSAQPYSWTVLTAGSITGFTGTGQFVVDTSNFYNPAFGSFTLAQSGNSLVLNFSPIPEPSTYALMLAGLGVTIFAARRRRR